MDFFSFDILSDDEERVIAELNQTGKAYPAQATIHGVISARAAASPEQTAIIEQNGRLTYRQLDEQSNRLAALLAQAGAVPNSLIAIAAGRSTALVTSVLGILKAGAAYMPIDPDYPKKRIRYMLHDSACRILVTEAAILQSLRDDLPESIETIICLDETEDAPDALTVLQQKDIEQMPVHGWANVNSEDDLAYVIYTSGSTGEPKGVMITHRAVLNTLFWLQDAFALTEQDVIAQKTSASFTDSVWEFFWPLMVGAQLSIIPADAVKDPLRLYSQLKADRVSVTQFVPAQMSLFLDVVKGEQDASLPQLKWVFNGGEALPVNIAREWYGVFGQAHIANIYGMTESAIYATEYILDGPPDDGTLSIPLGRPIANAHVYIMDGQGQHCPFDVKGEICIGGPGIAAGYWNKAELTQKAFMKHPGTGERLYCTGDLGLLRPDGVLEYLGRKDDQVQVRGYRVELKEVERAVSGFRLIKENAVISRPDSAGSNELLCYFTTHEKGIDVDELAEHMRELLPNYMIPVYFMELNEMPLTPNGKIDRRKLPEVQSKVSRTGEYVAPRNAMEQALVKIWADILRASEEEIGIHDSFLEIGGNSISIVRLHRKIRQTLGIEITVAELFSYPTIALWMDHYDNRGNSKDTGGDEEEQLTRDLMELLDQVEEGTIDVGHSVEAFDKLQGG
ncbi:non-ribosomal peptide synthetase [Paenibacillus tepidiphilus]|uniref:non-ribosomal peptide synthetase n=1 Tax=Paenibacillus tepidiphilus TaxID=2608683 RepID=UPI001EEF93A7|nr:non-ribosomal peptide synthetase [Paenibacillus tepidiphilus]